MTLLDAVKLAYRKHHLNDDSIGWDELSECLLDALCNEMGDDGFQQWLGSQQAVETDANDLCKYCHAGETAPHLIGCPNRHR